MLSIAAKPLVEKLKAEVSTQVQTFKNSSGRAPKLSVVLVGEDPASVIYTTNKGKMAESLGMLHETIRLPAHSSPQKVKETIEKLNGDPLVDGILIQRPLPKGFKEEEVVYWVAPEKDVDVFHPENTGRLTLGLPGLKPCTPYGVMLLLEHYKIPVTGKLACVVGRSSIVGKPMASLLLQADATVLQCHSKTRNLKDLCKQADVLIAAIGKPAFIDASYIKQGAIVVDVGIHKTAEGKTIGDVAPDAVKVAGALSPVPGGIGPMTIQVLMLNTLQAAQNRHAQNNETKKK